MSNEAPTAAHPVAMAAVSSTSGISIWAYLGLAISMAAAVPQIIAIFKTPGPIQGPELQAAAMSVIIGLQGVVHIQVPLDLVTKLADATAQIINGYYKRIPAA